MCNDIHVFLLLSSLITSLTQCFPNFIRVKTSSDRVKLKGKKLANNDDSRDEKEHFRHKHISNCSFMFPTHTHDTPHKTFPQ